MYRRSLIGTKSYILDTDKELILDYYIIEKQQIDSSSYYGIEIAQTNKTKDIVEYKNLILSECKQWVLDILNKFIKNGVTPITMEYIIDDIMSQLPC